MNGRIATTVAVALALSVGYALGLSQRSGQATAARASSLGGPLHLADEGIVYVRVTSASSNGGTTSTVMGGTHAYAQFRIPVEVSGPPLVMVGGSNDTGASYETTPDGREGWATYFARQGFPVYTVDGPGRGRSGFNVAPFARAKAANDASLIPDVPMLTDFPASRWPSLRLGPKYPELWPDSQFPVEAIDQFDAQYVPNGERTLGTEEETRHLTVNALISVLEQSGPGILVVHSQSGLYALMALAKRPELVKAIVSTEGSCVPVTPAEIATFPKADVDAQLQQTPFLSIFGAHSEFYPETWNGLTRREHCRNATTAVKNAGGPSTFWVLPDMGVHGNSHAMVQEKNNLQIADMVITWIRETVK